MRRSCRDPFYIQLVYEYLLHLGLLETAASLKNECGLQQYHVPHDKKEEGSLKFKLLNYFDSRDADSFFEAFDSVMSSSNFNSAEVKKLMVDLHLYFATTSMIDTEGIFSGRPSNFSEDCSIVQPQFHSDTGDKTSASTTDSHAHSNFLRLSNFLERNCSSLRHDAEFLPYFSDSFMVNPQHHHLYHQALQGSWILNTRRRLQSYLWIYFPPQKIPDIVLLLSPNFTGEEECHKYELHAHDETKNERYFPSCCMMNEDNLVQILSVNRRNEIKQDFKKEIVDHRLNDSTGNESVLASDNSQNENSRESDKSQAVHSHRSTLFIKRHNNQKIASSMQQLTSNSVGSDESFTLNEKLEECLLSYAQLKKKFTKLHTDYHNLIGVASELTSALENTARGQQIDLTETLNNCLRIFPELFSSKKLKKRQKTKVNERRFSLQPPSYEWNLHISLIKSHLEEGNMKTRLLLLQALRWAITRSSSVKRESVMNQTLVYDILNLQGNTILKSLLIPPGVITPHPLQQSAARLLNTLASLQKGRSYLAQNSEVVHVTSAVLQEHDGVSTDSITRSMLVAALQKLSLRRNQRIAMIQSHMVEWLFQQLSNVSLESSYSLEYGTALLMNLCLHQSAKEICIPTAENVIRVLMQLLSTSVTQALPYINGILYSLLSHPVLNEAAMKIGLSKVLEEYIMGQSNLEIKKQMEHILEYHTSLLQCKHGNSFPLPVSEGEMMDEDDEDLDLLGEELDEQDPVRNINGELCGEDLLKTHYTLPHQNHGNLNETSLSESEDNGSRSTLLTLRPTTPHYSSQLISASLRSDSGQLTNEVKVKSHEQTVQKDRQHRQGGSKQEGINGRWNDDLSKSLPNKVDLNKTYIKGQHETVSKENITSFVGTHNEASGSGYDAPKHLLTFCDNKQRELPQIAIHLVGQADSCGDSDNDHDDSDDVQVGELPNQEIFVEQISHSHMEIVESSRVKEEQKPSARVESCEVKAFTSRPKIPRTPPH